MRRIDAGTESLLDMRSIQGSSPGFTYRDADASADASTSNQQHSMRYRNQICHFLECTIIFRANINGKHIRGLDG